MHKFIKKHCTLFFILIPFIFFAQNGIIIGKVIDDYGSLPGVKLTIEGKPIYTQTDTNGNYSLKVPEGQYTLNASFITYQKNSKKIKVTSGDTLIVNYTLKTSIGIDQQFSLGSRAEPRSLLETTAPVDIISPKDISDSNQIELSSILHYITPSFYSTNQTIADGTDHIDPATLRGLGPDQILVLINGKRRHASSLLNVNGTVGRGAVGTDFNAIPISSIDRIEILRDGATSQYGSDAIAGVINIILKKQTKDIIIDTRAQINTEGDGFTRYVGTNFGLTIGDKGFVNVSTEYRERDASNRAGNYTGTVFTKDTDLDNALIAESDFFNQTGFEDRQVMQIGPAETQNISLAINSEYPISKNTTIHAFALRNYREGKSRGFFRFPKETEKVVSSLFPNGFSPEILTDIQDDAVSIGISGVKNYWDVNFSHTIGVNRLDFSVANSNNASLGIASPTFFDTGGYLYKLNTTNMDISRSFDYLEGINIAFGGELRVENYQITAGEEASYIDGGVTFVNEDGIEERKIAGAQVFPGIQPQNELNKFRTNSSFYFDIETKVNSQLLISTATRYETYSDFGGQLTWKLAGRYKVKDQLNVRLGLATGYRAPSLHQVFFNNISTQFESDGQAIQVGTFNNESAEAKSFGIELLKPEISNHFSGGFTSRIKENLTFTFDYYYIKIKDRIVLSGQLDKIDTGTAQFLTNAVDTKTNGADGVLVYNTNLYNGKLITSLSANITKTRVDGPIKIPDLIRSTGQEDDFFNREEVSRLESAQPEFKISSILGYNIKKIDINLSNTYFGSVTYLHPEDGDRNNWQLNTFTGRIESRDQRFSPKILTNIALSHKILNNLTVTLAGNNILNIFPDKQTHSANTNEGNFVFSRRVQQFGTLGANYSLRFLLNL